ncbi:hypothetical protein EVC37_08895 [Methylocaldum sp. BRCS4]|nr:hypothetical protein [Methylocaldum sp. BRCS4]
MTDARLAASERICSDGDMPARLQITSDTLLVMLFGFRGIGSTKGHDCSLHGSVFKDLLVGFFQKVKFTENINHSI